MKRITDEVMENVEILAKLELSEEERKKAAEEMEKMLQYVEKLQELDTEDVEPVTCAVTLENVFREDVVTNGDGREETLANAPQRKEDSFEVPRTIG